MFSSSTCVPLASGLVAATSFARTAAAFQRLGRARIFGGQSAGQALPAMLTRLPNGDRLMYVIADFTGPGGARIEGEGVIPDEPVARSRRSLLAGRDEALKAAVRWIESPGRPVGGLR